MKLFNTTFVIISVNFFKTLFNISYHVGIIFSTYRMKLADQKHGTSNISHSSISFVSTVFLCTNKRNCFENNLKQLKITVL